MKISIMQPYFVPYLGYFRLLSDVDLFVVYDCVQFPRRGWVHRNQILTRDQQKKWITLPLKKAPQDTRICDVRFRDQMEETWQQTIDQINHREKAKEKGLEPLFRDILDLKRSVVDYLMQTLRRSCEMLSISPPPMLRSSTLDIPHHLKGAQRILHICDHFKADTYINAPGGRGLYDETEFKARGIQLTFLTPYEGEPMSVLQYLLNQSNQ